MQSIYTTPPRIPTLPPSFPLKLPISNSKKQPSQLLLQTLNNSQVSPYIDADPTENGTDSLKVSLPAHVKSITSTSNPFVKHCVKLQRSSPYRHSHSSTLVVGSTPIREICSKQKPHRERTVDVECLFLLDKAQVPEGVDESSTHVLRVSAFVMKKISQIQSTESIDAIALLKFPTSYFVLGDNEVVDCRKWFPSPHRILVLEGIQDPGNLGNLIRSAVAFRWGGVFLLPGCCDPFGGRALRSSRGAAFQLPIVSGTWHHLEALRNEFNLKMVAGHPDKDTELKPVSRLTQELADSLADVPLCLVLGSEGKGLTSKSFQECELVSIQMPGKFESLNVSVAGGIFMHMLQAENPRTV